MENSSSRKGYLYMIIHIWLPPKTDYFHDSRSGKFIYFNNFLNIFKYGVMKYSELRQNPKKS